MDSKDRRTGNYGDDQSKGASEDWCDVCERTPDEGATLYRVRPGVDNILCADDLVIHYTEIRHGRDPVEPPYVILELVALPTWAAQAERLLRRFDNLHGFARDKSVGQAFNELRAEARVLLDARQRELAA